MSKEKSFSLIELANVTAKDFQNDKVTALALRDESGNYDKFKLRLQERIKYLLENKYELLISILYKIDVDERKLSELFSKSNREFIPAALADLIIERQLQKLKFRQKYKNVNQSRELDE